MMGANIRRRQLLGGSAALLSVVLLPGCASCPVIPKRPSPDTRTGLSWISHQSGRHVLALPRVEMGQNIATALKQIACDELGIGLDQLQVRLHGTDSIDPVRATMGSESIMDFALPLARACATLRQALGNGQVIDKLEAVDLPREQLRAFSRQSQWVGRSPVLEQGHEILTGQPLFASDVRLPGNHHQVKVQGCGVGGAFGGKTVSTVELEAAVLAHALKVPVKVPWTRTQEFLQAFHRPPSSHRIRVRLKAGRSRTRCRPFGTSGSGDD
jgi:CO/xanthine dehydrogenase Mo-binding subunit